MIRLYISLLKLKRALQIFGILLRYAFVELLAHIRLFNSHKGRVFKKGAKKNSTQRNVYSTPQRIRELIEELGPTYVKFGQVLADRSDVVSERFRIELKKLQSKAEPFDNDIALSIIEQSLGKNIEDIFETFETTPLAAASIGQVYKATLLNSSNEVVIKVQRPFIENKIKLDTYLMKYLAAKLARSYPELAAINIIGLVDEFSVNILKELDYSIEANNNQIFERMFSGSRTVKIPHIYTEYTTRRTLVSEYIQGITPDSRESIERAGLNPDIVTRNGADAMFEMILANGVFHADPHPGNLFVLKNNRIAFIDFGMIGILRTKDINFLADFTVGFSKKNSTTITKSLLTLCDIKYFDKEDELSFAIHKMLMQNFMSKSIELKNYSHVLKSSIDILVQFDLAIPGTIFLLIKTLTTLEKFTETISPTIELSPIVLPFAQKVIEERYSARRIAQEIYETATKYVNFFNMLPTNMSAILYKIKEGTIKHDIQLTDDALFIKSARKISLRIAYVLLTTGFFIGGTVLVATDTMHRFGHVILYISTAMIGLLLLKWIFGSRN